MGIDPLTDIFPTSACTRSISTVHLRGHLILPAYLPSRKSTGYFDYHFGFIIELSRYAKLIDSTLTQGRYRFNLYQLRTSREINVTSQLPNCIQSWTGV